MPTRDDFVKEANRDATTSPKRVTVLYADHGKRKTSTAAAMVNERGLMISSDDSWKVLLNDRHKELYNKLKIIPYDGVSQLEYVDFSGYDTIIWDTFSQSSDEYLDLLYDQGSWGGKYREKISSTHKDLRNVSVLAPMDYRVLRDVFRPVLNRLFETTNAHIVFTSQMKEPIPGLSKDSAVRPDIPAATFKIIGTRADIIGYLQPATRGKFTIDVTENSVVSLGKSRIEGLQGKMDLDDFVNTYRKIVF